MEVRFFMRYGDCQPANDLPQTEKLMLKSLLQRPSILADLNLLGVALIWGFNMAIMKFALGRIDPYLFNAMRLTLSAVVLGVCVWFQTGRGSSKRESAKEEANSGKEISSPVRHWSQLVAFAFLAGFAYQLLFLIGINSTSAGNTALIMSAIPMWTAILAFWLLREKLTARGWLGLATAVVGVVVVSVYKPSAATSIGTLSGNLFVSAAAFSWALGSVVSRPLMKKTSPMMLAFLSVALTAPFHWLVAWQAWDETARIASDGWLLIALLYSGIFSTGLAYAMWNLGVKHLGASHAAGYQNLVPLVALLASWWLIEEIPYWLQLVGGGLILVGLLTMRSSREIPKSG